MENAEFLYHLNIIKNLMKDKRSRIILLHIPYTKTQQKIIDSICRNSIQIIGQIERKEPKINVSREIKRLIESNKEPFIPSDQLRYVILGRQKPKINVFH